MFRKSRNASLGKRRANQLKRRMMPTEIMLHDAMKKNRWRFQSQVPMYDHDRLYIVDFLVDLYGGRLVVEVDGPSHIGKEQYDANRDAWLRTYRNCTILRVTAKEVLLELPRIIGIIRAYFPRHL
jgi:very-short-patch-repair endonuclease